MRGRPPGQPSKRRRQQSPPPEREWHTPPELEKFKAKVFGEPKVISRKPYWRKFRNNSPSNAIIGENGVTIWERPTMQSGAKYHKPKYFARGFKAEKWRAATDKEIATYKEFFPTK